MKIKLGLLILGIIFALAGCTGKNEQLKNERDERSLKQAAITNVQLGVGYIRRGQLKIAKEKLLKAIELDEENVTAYTTMAFLMMELGEMEAAGDYYLEALDVKGKDPELSNSYGTYLCRVGLVDDAMAQFKLAYSDRFYKSAYLAYANAGTCLMQVNQNERAEKFLRQALKVQPELSTALISMAELSVKTKKYMKARAYAQRYHAINRPSAESLWVLVLAERALGAKDHYYKYAREIYSSFPDSKQAGLLGELARRDRIKKY